MTGKTKYDLDRGKTPAKIPVEMVEISSVRKPKKIPVIFAEAGTIYFAKKTGNARCYVCSRKIEEGEPYRVSMDSRHFKHVECPTGKVKGK